MKVSFEGIGETVATFRNDETAPAVKNGAVKIAAADTAANCADGDKIAGFCVDAGTEFATVQVGGFVTAPYTGTAPTVGFITMAADGTGGVKAVTTGGREYLAVSVDTTAKTVSFIM